MNTAAEPRRAPLFLHVLSLELRKTLSYRVDFWMNFLGTLVAEFAIAWFLWQSIFAYRDAETIGGYSFHGMMLYYLIAPMIFKAVRGAEDGFIAREIYDGSLTRYLIYPVNFFTYKFAASLAARCVALVQMYLVMGVALWVVGRPPEMAITVEGVLLATIAVMLGGVVAFFMNGALELVAFWADNVWSLNVMQRMFLYFFGGVALPLSLFPEWAQELLHVLPYALMVSFPMQVLQGDIGLEQYLINMALLVGWALVFWVVIWTVWRRGSLQYTGVGI